MQSKYNPKIQNQQNKKCAYCGAYSNVTFEQVMSDHLTSSGTNGDYSVYRSTPTRTPQIEADVLVPAGKSLMSAIATTLPAMVVGVWFRWEWYAPLAVGALTIFVQWFRFLNDQNINAIEEFSYSPSERGGRAKLDKAGIGLEVIHKGDSVRNQMQFRNLPASVSQEKFLEFCKDVCTGKPLARVNWVGRGRLFSRDVYDRLITELMEVSVVVSNPEGGRMLSSGGKRALQRYIQFSG